MKISKQKTGLPFIIFLIIITVFISLWFLKSQNDISKQSSGENKNSVNSNSNQLKTVNEDKSGIIEDNKTKNRTFQNPDYNFKVTLIGKETVKETSSEGIYTLHLDDNKISAMAEIKEGEVKGSVTTTSEESITVDGISGIKIISTSPKDGSEINLILVKNGGRLYYFQGTNDFLERMVKDFSFTP